MEWNEGTNADTCGRATSNHTKRNTLNVDMKGRLKRDLNKIAHLFT